MTCFVCRVLCSSLVRRVQVNETKFNNLFLLFIHEFFFLQKLPPVLNLQELEAYRDKLKQQQAAVSKKKNTFLSDKTLDETQQRGIMLADLWF